MGRERARAHTHAHTQREQEAAHTKIEKDLVHANKESGKKWCDTFVLAFICGCIFTRASTRGCMHVLLCVHIYKYTYTYCDCLSRSHQKKRHSWRKRVVQASSGAIGVRAGPFSPARACAHRRAGERGVFEPVSAHLHPFFGQCRSSRASQRCIRALGSSGRPSWGHNRTLHGCRPAETAVQRAFLRVAQDRVHVDNAVVAWVPKRAQPHPQLRG
jgi:hypothetical protein